MATNTQLKFYKVNGMPSTGLVVGAIYFDKLTGMINVATSATAYERFGGRISETEWNEDSKILSITKNDGNKIQLNFSDIASHQAVYAELQRIEGLVTNAQNAANAAQADADALEEALGSGFSKSSTVASQLAAVKATADAAAVKSVVDAALDLKADKTQVATDIATAKSGAEATAAADATSKANKAKEDAIAEAVRLDGLMDARVDALEAAIGENGSVDQAIADAIAALDTPEAGVTGNGSFVNVTVKQVDGKVTEVSVSESDIAKASDLASEASRAAAAEEALGGHIDLLDAATTGRVSVLEEQVRSLNAATHFEGVVEGETFEDAIAASNKTFESGDIVIYGNKEYIFDGENWIELGDTTAEQGRLSTLEDWQATASQQIADNKANIEANDGEITALQNRAKAIEDNITNNIATKDELSSAQTTLNAEIQKNAGAITALQGVDSGFETRIKANEDAIKAIDLELDSMATSETVNSINTRLGAVESAITRLDGEQDAQDTAIEAAAAKGQQGIDDAAAALAKANEKVAKVTGSEFINIGGSDTEPSVSAITSDIAENANGLAKAADVFNALCWVEFN